MKKLLFCTMLFALSIAYGQESTKKEKLTIQKGTWYVNGGFSLFANAAESNENEINSNQTGFNITPKIGYTITKDLIIGLGINYSYQKNKFEDFQSNNSQLNQSYGIFSYIKRYFSFGKKLAISLQGEFRYSYSKYEFNNINNPNYLNNNNDHQYFIGIRPGITYFLNNKIALEANIGALGYTRINRKTSSDQTSNIDHFNFNLDSNYISFGLSYYW